MIMQLFVSFNLNSTAGILRFVTTECSCHRSSTYEHTVTLACSLKREVFISDQSIIFQRYDEGFNQKHLTDDTKKHVT